MFNVAVLTVSDRCSRGESEDRSGQVLVETIKNVDGNVIRHEIVPDEKNLIKEKLLVYCDDLGVDLVLTTGGTGPGPRDVTPEATREVIQKIMPGIAELMRIEGLKRTRNAALSRGISAIRKNSIIINLAGSPKAALDSLEAVLDIIPHAIDMLRGGNHRQ